MKIVENINHHQHNRCDPSEWLNLTPYVPHNENFLLAIKKEEEEQQQQRLSNISHLIRQKKSAEKKLALSTKVKSRIQSERPIPMFSNKVHRRMKVWENNCVCWSTKPIFNY